MPTNSSFHPFAMMVDPGAVLRAIESSSALGRLHARVFRPLERQEGSLLADDDLAAFDAEVDALAVEDEVHNVEYRSSFDSCVAMEGSSSVHEEAFQGKGSGHSG